MKVYKVELMIIDFDEIGENGIRSVLENTRFPNDCMNPHVAAVSEREIGDWDDDHLLNKRTTMLPEFRRLFRS